MFKRFRVPKRQLVPLLIIISAKVVGLVIIGNLLNIQTSGTFWSDPNRVYAWPQNRAFLTNTGAVGNWPLAFFGWDSAWYLSIMTKGYDFSSQSYTFSPALPFFSNLTNSVLQNPMISLALTALVFGVLWIPLYQILAESYIGKKAAFFSTLFLSFSPYIFVFTTVAYSEGLLLFFVLGAWVLFKRGNLFGALTFAMIAPLTRSMGILVVLPLLYVSFRQKSHRIRNIFLSFLPIASLTSWFAVLGFSFGDFLAPVHTSEWAQLYSFRTLLTEGIPRYGLNVLFEAPFQPSPIPTNWLLPFAVILALLLPLFLFSGTWKTDKSLWLYSLAGYGGILYFGALVSVPRFMSVLFPLWIPIMANFSGKKKSVICAAILITISYIVAIDLWLSFLNGQFIA